MKGLIFLLVSQDLRFGFGVSKLQMSMELSFHTARELAGPFPLQ